MRFAKLLLLSALACGCLSAAPVTWYLSGVTLSDGGRAFGSFTFDATTSTYSNVNLMTTPGTATTSGGAALGGKNYGTNLVPGFQTAQQVVVTSASSVVINNTSLFGVLVAAPLTDAGGAVAVTTGVGIEGLCGNATCTSFGGARSFTGGKVVALSSTSPKTWYLNRVSLDDGGQAAGSFTYDAGTNTYTNVDVWTTAGITFATPVHYVAAKVAPGSRNATAATVSLVTRNPALANDRILVINLTALMTNTGGTVNIGTTNGETTCADVGCDNIFGVSRQPSSGTITTVKPTGYTKILSDIVDGGNFQTVAQVTNLTDVPATYIISFFTDAGAAYNVPGIGTSVAVTVSARGTSQLSSTGGAGALTQGWARVDGADNFNPSAVFKLSGLAIGAVENAVFGEPQGATSVSFPFDNTNGAVGGLALTNSNPTRAVTVLAVAYDQTGTRLTNNTTVTLPANGHTAFNFGVGAGAGYAGLLNQRGVLRLFAIPNGGDAPAPFAGVNGLLLKFLPNLSNTTVQGIHQ